MPSEVGLLLLKYPTSTVRCQRHAVRSSVRSFLQLKALEVAEKPSDLFSRHAMGLKCSIIGYRQRKMSTILLWAGLKPPRADSFQPGDLNDRLPDDDPAPVLLCKEETTCTYLKSSRNLWRGTAK